MEITSSNYTTTLKQSTKSRADGNMDGNVYFDKANHSIELFASDEVAQIDFGGGAVANPLIRADGIRFVALYDFENQERAVDETLRMFNRWTEGTFKKGGAYKFVYGGHFSTENDIKLITGSGWDELDSSKVLQKSYFGNVGLSNIESTSSPYYQLGEFTTPIPFAKSGNINESILVYDLANSIDNRNTNEILSVRTYGKTYDRKSTLYDLKVSDIGGFSTGFALDEEPHPTTNTSTMPIGDVYNSTPSSQVGVWKDMELVKLGTPITETGFSGGDGTFTWLLKNTSGANLNECIAWLDAYSAVSADGRKYNTWYNIDSGVFITKSGADSLGVFIENIPTEDQQRVRFTDDSGDIKSYIFLVSIVATVGSIAKADTNAWYQAFGASNFGTESAVTVLSVDGTPFKGMASNADNNYNVNIAFNYDSDTILGSAGTDKDCVFLCEGDGGATQAKTLFTITRNEKISFACEPSVENNN